MARRIQTKGIQRRKRISQSGIGPADLKIVVRDGLASMTAADREAFILALETELRYKSLSMRGYLIPLGISASSLDELTPSDVGHLVRFLKLNVPGAMRAVDGIIERFAISAENVVSSGDRLAA
jgi:hypothetical protein